MSNLCFYCHRGIHLSDIVYLEIQMCEASFSGPAEYNDVALHPACYTKMTDPEYDEHLRDEAVDRRRDEREAER